MTKMPNRFWEHLVPNGTTPTSEKSGQITDDDAKVPSAEQPPGYEEATGISSSSPQQTPPKLQILAATWGGVIVTSEIQVMVTEESQCGSSSAGARDSFDDTLTLNMHTLHTKLVPDPNIGSVKSLSVLYKYSNETEMHLLNAPQFAPQLTFTIKPADQNQQTDTKRKAHRSCTPQVFFDNVNTTSWTDASGKVEIIAALYGTQKVQIPSVLEELARLFRGERGQIRTTSEFFRANPAQVLVGPQKTWTVYFRLLGDGSGGKVRCVTGWENGALEVPWTF